MCVGKLALLLLCVDLITSCEIPRDLEETWGYVDVRPMAHQFWWFMKTPCGDAAKKPIIIWLQGGPGGSGTGYGNFMEIGPIDNLNNSRNYTWLKEASLIFIDSPVGAGFSYVDEASALTTTVYEVADDLVIALGNISKTLKAQFFDDSDLPPIYIFGESYGGKVAPVFGAKIVDAQKKGFLKGVDLAGVAIGDGAVSLLDSVLAYPEFLYQTSQIDYTQYTSLVDATKDMEEAYDEADTSHALSMMWHIMNTIEAYTDYVSFYNIIHHNLTPPSLMASMGYSRLFGQTMPYKRLTNEQKELLWTDYPFKKFDIDYNGDNVKALMNNEMRKKFGIIPDDLEWGGQAMYCYLMLLDEVLIDVISSVDECLEKDVRVIVYNGMLDLIISSPGQDRWINKLTWSGLKNYYKAHRTPLYAPSQAKDEKTGAFYKGYKNFEYYWVLMSGHMVPIDVPEIALEMVRLITGPPVAEKFKSV